ncbi:MAG: nitrate/sulfonate/bicarbonate ABC transporter ATP-binding protein [Legionellales bacterium]|nr:nitrate/sulfonate/bicarbonate ABC transporter ATP-binding protein [Legionellales bacterium]
MKLLQAKNITKTFKSNDPNQSLILDNINLELNDGEIVAILGKSGSGKSTLLRILTGLTSPTSGEVLYRGTTVTKPIKGIGMVFQHFALMPWLTVLQNVELGLEALGVPREERRTRAIHAIDTIGMDGFESAFPKELSGGMRQRVGFARALVVNPDILIMDEPFSALDILTAENLKTDLLELWQNKKTKTSGIILVTHNIEEAALLANRILIFSSNPGKIAASVNVKQPYPRNTQSKDFIELVDLIYTLVTTAQKSKDQSTIKTQQYGIGYRLPDVSTDKIMGLIETLYSDFANKGAVDLPELADFLAMDLDSLLPITEALEILGFAEVSFGDIKLSETGKQFFSADLLDRKGLFAKQLVKKIPLANEIRRVLDEKRNHQASEERFLSKLEYYLSEKESERVLRTIIDWGRYAEIFAYDYNTGTLSLENPD